MDTTGGLGALAGTVEGINQGLSTFMQNDLNMQMKKQDQDAELSKEEKIATFKQQQANQNAPTVTAGHLIAANPKFKSIFGDSDPNTPIALDNIDKYKAILPDEDAKSAKTANANNMVSVDALDGLLSTAGVDDEDRKDTIDKFKKSGVKALPTGVIENIVKSAGGDVRTATVVSLLKDDPTFQSLTDDQKAAKVKSLKASLKGQGLKDIPDEQVDQVAQQSMSAYKAAQSDPGQFPDPFAAVGQELSKRYKDKAVNKVLVRLHDLSQKGAGAQPPPEKDRGVTSFLKKLYGG